MSATTLSTGSPRAAGGRLPFSSRTAGVVGAALLAAGVGAAWIASPKGVVSTDDAYLQADSTVVAPKVRGLVAEILVRDNQVVSVGDPLVRIDAEEFNARAAAAQADLSGAEASVESARAALDSLAADQQLAQANVHAAETSIAAADAQRSRAGADRRRYDNLAASGAVTGQEVDSARAAADSRLRRRACACCASGEPPPGWRCRRAPPCLAGGCGAG